MVIFTLTKLGNKTDILFREKINMNKYVRADNHFHADLR